jgi:hypothetical protein
MLSRCIWSALAEASEEIKIADAVLDGDPVTKH